MCIASWDNSVQQQHTQNSTINQPIVLTMFTVLAYRVSMITFATSDGNAISFKGIWS